MMGFYASGAMGQGGGGGGALYDLITADIGTYGGIYMRLGESSGTVAVNEAGSPDGAYVNSPTLGQPALYSGGPTSMYTNASNMMATFPGASVPALTEMTLGIIYKPDSLGSLRLLLTRDTDFGSRFWQWRLNGSNMEFIKIIGGVESVSGAHGMSAGNAYLVMVTVTSAGGVKMFRTGSLVTSGSVSAADYGGSSGTDVAIGSRYLQNEATDSYFSESFVIAGALSDSRVAEYAAATGL